MDATVRPRLRRDAYLLPTADGARILTNSGAESLTGASIHQWLARLAPYLDGRATLGDLTSALPADRRALVEQIVGVLFERGLLHDGAAEPSAEFGYLDSFVPDAADALRRHRAATVLASGSGPVHAALPWPAIGAVEPDLRVHIGDAESALAVHRECRRRGVPLVLGVHLGDELWISADADWESAWYRLHTVPPVRDEVVRPEAVALAVGMLELAVFRLLSGAAGAADRGCVSCLDLVTLGTTTHRVLPFVGSSEPTGATAAALLPEELDAAGAVLLDGRLGVLGEVSERDFTQLPLNVAAVTVGRPRRLVTGAGVSVREARWRAVLAGVASHCASTVDPSRLVDGRVRGHRLVDGSARLVAAARVFDPAAPGVAARFDRDAAILAGLLGCCAARPGAGRGVLDLSTVDGLDGSDDDDEAVACLRMLDILGVRPVVHDVTGPLGVPTLAFGTADRTVAYVAGLRAADTLADGLRAVLLDEQSRAAGEPDYRPPPVAQAARSSVVVATPPPIGLAELVARLDPVVVPLDHDAEVHRIVPHVVAVVIADD